MLYNSGGNRARCALGRFEITRPITSWIVLHSVLLPLLIIIIIIKLLIMTTGCLPYLMTALGKSLLKTFVLKNQSFSMEFLFSKSSERSPWDLQIWKLSKIVFFEIVDLVVHVYGCLRQNCQGCIKFYFLFNRSATVLICLTIRQNSN